MTGLFLILAFVSLGIGLLNVLAAAFSAVPRGETAAMIKASAWATPALLLAAGAAAYFGV